MTVLKDGGPGGRHQRLRVRTALSGITIQAAKCGTKGEGHVQYARLVLLPARCFPPRFPQPQKKKGPSAEFSCVNLPNPRPWHFCFGSQTLLVFSGVFVLLKDIIKPFFFPFEKCRPPRALRLHVLSLLSKLQLIGGRGVQSVPEHRAHESTGDRHRLLESVAWIPRPWSHPQA